VAPRSPIALRDVDQASTAAVAELDEGVFRVRFDRLTPAERRNLRAMADVGPGPHRSGDIAAELGRQVTSLGPTRSQLIEKGMVWSPSHGDTAFTVPLFDAFMKRIMPGDAWRSQESGRSARAPRRGRIRRDPLPPAPAPRVQRRRAPWISHAGALDSAPHPASSRSWRACSRFPSAAA
jgi:hypothetical protein